MHLHSKLLLTLAVTAVSITNIYGQDVMPLQGEGVEANFLAARVVKHTVKFTAPIPPLTTAIDVNFVWQTYGKREWEQRRNYPLLGLGMTYTDYGNEKVFGNCVGLYPNIQFRILQTRKMEWTLRFGDGIGYVTKKYQKTQPVDTVNTAISTHLNDFAMLMIDLRYLLNEHWHLQYGINFTHISNGGTESPNLGVNTAGTHIGVRYFPVTYRPKRLIKQLPKLSDRWLFQARMDFSYRQARAAGNPILPVYMPSVYVSRRWLSKNKFFGGVDYAFHNDVLAFLNTYCSNLDHKIDRSWDGYVFVGNEFLMGRIGLVTQVGVNYHQTYLKFDPYCEKLGGNIYIIKKEHGPIKELFISGFLLAHGFVAELAEFGAGIGL
jgi:lipid A 3-O-deacylase PagL